MALAKAVTEQIVIGGIKLGVQAWKNFKKAYNAAKKEDGGYGMQELVEGDYVPTASNAVAQAAKIKGVNVKKFVNDGNPRGLLLAMKRQMRRNIYIPQRGELYRSTVPTSKQINVDAKVKGPPRKMGGGKVKKYGYMGGGRVYSQPRKAKYTAG